MREIGIGQFRAYLIGVVLLLVPALALAGGLDSPGATRKGSGMPTTTAIYDRLASGADILVLDTFNKPVGGPAPTGRTLAEIQAKLPVPDVDNGATSVEVAAGKTFWGLRPDATWGQQVGTGAFSVPAVAGSSPARDSESSSHAMSPIASQASAPLATALDSPGTPEAGGGMPTTTAIYNRLAGGAEIPVSGAFTEAAGAPVAPTGRTLAEILAKLPVPDASNGATPADVVGGKTFWSLRPDTTWGLQVGSANCGADTGMYNSPQFTDAELTIYSDVQYSVRPNYEGIQCTSDFTKEAELGTAELQLKLDVAVPPNATALTPQPLVVWIHGGGLGSGNKERGFPLLLTYARAGYVVATVNYRLTPKNKGTPGLLIRAIKNSTEDVMNAIRFLKVNAATYHIDLTRIVVGGGSAGGIPVQLNAVEYDTLTEAVSDFPGVSSQVAASFTSGVTMVGEGYNPDTFVHYNSTDTPLLLLHAKPTDGETKATWSKNVLPTQSRINASGNTCIVVPQPNLSHLIDWSLGAGYWPYLRAFFWDRLRLNELR